MAIYADVKSNVTGLKAGQKSGVQLRCNWSNRISGAWHGFGRATQSVEKIRTAELITDPERIRAEVVQLGRANKQADVLDYLATSADPLPSEAELLAATARRQKHLAKLEADGLIHRFAGETVSVRNGWQRCWKWCNRLLWDWQFGRNVGHILRLRGATEI